MCLWDMPLIAHFVRWVRGSTTRARECVEHFPESELELLLSTKKRYRYWTSCIVGFTLVRALGPAAARWQGLEILPVCRSGTRHECNWRPLGHRSSRPSLWIVRTMIISDFFTEPMKISVNLTDLGVDSYQRFTDH